MRRETLTNTIKGSVLKEQYLEAFLVQNAYIESLLKIFANYNFFVETKASPMAVGIAKRIEKYGFGELIDLLSESKFIDEDQKSALETYRKHKHKIMSDLMKEMSRDEFDKELRAACERGSAILEGKQFREIAELVESLEEEKVVQPLSASIPHPAATAQK